MGDLSEHFSRYEFRCKCGCGADHINPKLILVLQQLRYTVDMPVTILSGVRCERHNQSVGGASESQHVLGNAADVRVPGYAPTQIAAIADTILGDHGGVKPYKNKNFCHIDVRLGFWRG